MYQRHLLTPGPTPMSQEVRQAMYSATIHHRGPEFSEIFGRAREKLQWLFESDEAPLMLTCSGTGAFEAAMTNFTRREEKILCVTGGKFGERWAEMGRSLGLQVVEIPVEWGQAVNPSQIEDALKDHPDARALTISASETSTAVYHPIPEIAALTRQTEVLLLVDGITAVGVHELTVEEMGIDVLVSGSQKSFGLPPGLGFLAARQRAWDRCKDSDHPRYYFDLAKERSAQAKNQTAFTPAIPLVVGLDVMLSAMQREGKEGLYTRHARYSSACRAAGRALGLRPYAKRPSHSVTALELPASLSAPQVVAQARKKYGVTIAGGQDELKPRVIRIGHLGAFDPHDMITAISTLEWVLLDMEFEFEHGAGLRSAHEILSTLEFGA